MCLGGTVFIPFVIFFLGQRPHLRLKMACNLEVAPVSLSLSVPLLLLGDCEGRNNDSETFSLSNLPLCIFF